MIRTLECELDFNCPYLILLECIEKSNSHDDVADKIRLEFIDQHFVSYKHSNDYLQQRQPRQQQQRDRRRRTTTTRGNHLIQRTRCLINSKGIYMERRFFFCLHFKFCALLWRLQKQKLDIFVFFVCGRTDLSE